MSYVEKRNYIRMEMNCDMTYRFVDSNEIHQAQCLSISGSGIAFLASQSIDIGKEIEVSILTKSTLSPNMTALIEIVRCHADEHLHYHVAGIIRQIK